MFQEVDKLISDETVEHWASCGYDPDQTDIIKVVCEMAIELKEHRLREKQRWWHRLSRIRPGKRG